jgi:serine protease Do
MLAGAAVVLVVLVAAGPASLSAQRARPAAEPALADALALVDAFEAQVVSLVAKVRPAYIQVAGGSGVIVSPDGYALTNHHVVGTRHFNVRLPDGRVLPGYNVAADSRGDLALLRIDAGGEPLPYVPIGDSTALRRGQLALAIGNPFTYTQVGRGSVTVGVISAINRYQGGYNDAIQIDARVNPGNSGGPLITLAGEVVGIIGRIATRRTFGRRINTGIGYAIPTHQAVRFAQRAREAGGPIVARGVIQGLRFGADGEGRAIVRSVADGSDAAAMGLRAGDIIREIDGMPTPSALRAAGALGGYPPFVRLPIVVERAGSRVDLRVQLAPSETTSQGPIFPGDADAAYTVPALPDRVAPFALPEPRLRAFLGVRIDTDKDPDVAGAPVSSVIEASPAELAGIKKGDRIRRINGIEIDSVDDLQAAVESLSAGDKVVIEYERRYVWIVSRTFRKEITLGLYPDRP